LDFNHVLYFFGYVFEFGYQFFISGGYRIQIPVVFIKISQFEFAVNKGAVRFTLYCKVFKQPFKSEIRNYAITEFLDS
jgi:hypothetical protein